MQRPRVLVAGIGNVFRTDDGFGSEVARRLAVQPWPEGVRVVDYGIRGMHLAFDLLDRWDALIMVDALPEQGRVGEVVVIEIGPEDVGASAQGDVQVDAHGMDPVTVLASLVALGGRLPARALLVGCPVAEIRHGMELTPPVDAAVDEAVRVVRSLVVGALQPTGVT